MSADRFHDGEDIEPAPARELRPAPGLDRSGVTRGRRELAAENADLSRAVGELASENADLYKRIDSLEASLKTQQARFSAWAQEMANREDTRAAREETRAKREEAMADRIAELERGLAERQDAPDARRQQDQSRPGAGIAGRARGGEAERAERAEPQHRLRLPSDAVNNVVSLAAGGTMAELAIHVRELSPEYAGIGASAVALGAGLIAVWRERRKAKDDADRPKG